METINVEGIYGSVSGDGSAINLQVNGGELQVKLCIPSDHMPNLLRQLMLLSVSAGDAQGISRDMKPQLTTSASEVPATAIGFAIASPTETALIGRCGVTNVAIKVPHGSILQLAAEIQDLQSGA